VIQPFYTVGGIRRAKVCEVNFGDTRTQAIFMGIIGFSSFDPPSELELKSVKLMDELINWYNSVKNIKIK